MRVCFHFAVIQTTDQRSNFYNENGVVELDFSLKSVEHEKSQFI